MDHYEKQQTVFTPSNIEEIYQLPFGKKTIGKTKTARLLLAYVLNAVYTAKYCREDNQAPIAFNRMAVLCKGNFHYWSQLSKTLIDNGYLTCDNQCVKGQKSFHYALGPKMAKATWRRSTELYTFRLPVPTDKDRNQFKLKKSYKEELMKTTPTKRQWTQEEIEFWNWYLEEEMQGYYTYGKTGRVYGDWARVPRELRGCFMVDGEDVVEVDITNCQPLLLITFYPEETAEKRKFRRLAESGTLYEDIMEKCNLDDRDMVKRNVMQFLCGKVKSTEHIPQYFEREFPMLYGILITIIKKNYKKVAHQLQKVESDIVINRLWKEYPTHLPIHDAIISPISKHQEVKERLTQIIEEEYGIKASIKIEDRRPQ